MNHPDEQLPKKLSNTQDLLWIATWSELGWPFGRILKIINHKGSTRLRSRVIAPPQKKTDQYSTKAVLKYHFSILWGYCCHQTTYYIFTISKQASTWHILLRSHACISSVMQTENMLAMCHHHQQWVNNY